MSAYLDSSALVKLVIDEPESQAMRAYVGGQRGPLTTSALSRTEVVRSAATSDPSTILAARNLLSATNDIAVSRALLDAAADLAVRTGICSLDAIHLATALSVRRHLDAFVTYDRRQAAVAEELGLPVVTPA